MNIKEFHLMSDSINILSVDKILVFLNNSATFVGTFARKKETGSKIWKQMNEMIKFSSDCRIRVDISDF